jgi:hypothetical protein
MQCGYAFGRHPRFCALAVNGRSAFFETALLAYHWEHNVKAGLTPDGEGDTTLGGGHRLCAPVGRNARFHE